VKPVKTIKSNFSIRIYAKDDSRLYIEQFHFRGIKVKYYPATIHRASRVKLYDTRHKKTVWLPYSYRHGDIKSQAIEHLWNLGLEPGGFTYDEKSGEYTVLTTNFYDSI